MSDERSPVARVLGWLEETWKQAPPALRRYWPWFIAGGVVLGFLLVLAVRSAAPEPEAASAQGAAAQGNAAQGEPEEPEEPEEPDEEDGVGSAAPVEPPLAPGAVGVDAGPPLSPNVKLTFKTYPPRRASVTWGAKRLGFTDRNRPLVVERVRDSGPLDVVVRAPGYLPVHARAYTFNDTTVEVKITPVEKKDTLYGYQQPLADAGAPL